MLAVVLEDNRDFVGLGLAHDVVVGHHQPRGIDDEARAQRHALRAWLRGRFAGVDAAILEELFQELIEGRSLRHALEFAAAIAFVGGLVGRVGPFEDRDIDHGGQDLFHERRQARHLHEVTGRVFGLNLGERHEGKAGAQARGKRCGTKPPEARREP